jgi:hypothetical protein
MATPNIGQQVSTFVRDLVASPRVGAIGPQVSGLASSLNTARPYVTVPDRPGNGVAALPAKLSSNIPPGYGAVAAREGRTTALPLPTPTGNPWAGTSGGLATAKGTVSKPTPGHPNPFARGA